MELAVKRGSSSIIWNWFGFRKADVEQTSVVVCRVCGKNVSAKDGNTSNLFHHLKHQHKLEYDESQRMRTDAAAATSSARASGKKPPTQTKLADALAHSKPYGKESKRWKELTAAVAPG